MVQRLAAIGSRAKAAAKIDGYAPDDDHAGLGQRLLAYVLDSVVLFAFTMIFATASFLNIFLRSDSGNHSTTDGAIWTSVAILMLTVPAWFLLNLALCLKRGQTVGQYVIGLRLAGEDDAPPGLKRFVVYWLALHPLLFHPLIAVFWLLLAYVAISLSGSTPIFLAALVAALLSLVGPLAGLVFAIADPQRRAIHDRIAGVKVVRLQ